MRLFRNDPNLPEGKYPVVMRRDGKPVTDRFFVILLKDPNAPAALRAYADAARNNGMDPQFCADIEAMVDEAIEVGSQPGVVSHPDGDPVRKDDDRILSWARSLGCPGS